jgi:carbamoyl-phosphate synthase small subunit
VEGIDTRALTRRIRLEGAMRGVLSTNSSDVDSLLERVRAYPGLVGQDLVKSVICKKPYYWRDGAPEPMERWESQPPSGKLRVIVLECGVKYNILRNLERLGCDVLVFPADTSAPEIFSCDPNGVLLSNGPGDPAPLTYLVDTVRQLLGKIPIFGICLGHQILGQALGGRTAKMKFGHRGVNQPAKNMHSDRIEITSQNHGFIVESESLPVDTKKTHVNLNDDTLERLYYPSLKAFSVHYHPEAAPGPHDATYLFDQFINIMKMKEGV